MKTPFRIFCTFIFALLTSYTTTAQESDATSSPFDGLKLRSIGPAFMSGRIADIAIHPYNENIWYVAVGSGGVWKTMNSGTTWTPIFEKETSYSIGTVAIDPNHTETIWVGTGEDSGGRHVGFGDGVYRSDDGGQTWTNMGLKETQHISRVIVHPENSNTVWVTAQGPLWNKGGQRGLYKTTDGGKTWKKTLGDDAWTGVTELVYNPTNPDRMYAATWQRHRTVAAYIGNGPGTALYRSDDGGDTWEKLTNGLPKTPMGKTGLAISPHNPEVLYAAIELDRRKGALYRSNDGGSSWSKQSNTISGGTGPHYYQELYASPHQKDCLYLMDNTMQISEDGGKTFYRMNRNNKHGDNHAIAFKKHDPNYLLVGTDGGLYESFDLTKSWKYIENLPVTQFYKLAVDDAEPFYNIYGGTQDNSTEGGPSRTNNIHGIQNSDWRVVLNWDGHQPATEPGNPNIVYAERQEGTLSRLDMKTGEAVDIQPQPAVGDAIPRFNWDAPILVSPHKPSTIFFASQRVWKSENRGDSWTPISDDLTKNEERITLPIMGRQQSWDNAWDVLAMSNYNTVTSLSESPKQEGLIYAGTDDGLINVTENGGTNWRQIKVNQLPGVPSTAFVNDIKADLHDANTVYVALDNHKYGDFRPYLYKSTDKGQSWVSLTKSIPENHLVWRLVQDHVSPNLLFIGTEFGLFFSVNGGKQWTALKGNVPTISFRDLAVQKRENDLVAASFGRGFYILDDYAVLREIAADALNAPAKLFSIRDPWWYVQRAHLSFEANKGSQGDSHFVAPNPDFGAVFTYYLKEAPVLQKELRKKKEKRLTNQNIPFSGWDALEEEKLEQKPHLVFVVKNNAGEVVRNISKEATSGIHRTAWDLRYPSPSAIALGETKKPNDDEGPKGLLAPPGRYSVTMYLSHKGSVEQLDSPVDFEVKPLYKNTLEGSSMELASAFWRSFERASRTSYKIDKAIAKAEKKTKALQKALMASTANTANGLKQIKAIRDQINTLKSDYYGNQAKSEIGEKNPRSVSDRLFTIYLSLERSTYGPTETNKTQMQIITNMLTKAENDLNAIVSAMDKFEALLKASGAPYIDD
ncbi:WD40/YVTN/BNR-like repeat-containing protein [Croceitalea rosinachiae]|uniref:Glycosyl hydrolase n=1 Tax=Croceitalea rosinachiae TaxID=3075596 RepID=A0ABU3ACT1_9FLAO|nr:glycosyl hydrolase [Croceitalea sp. F388]MDT0607610.1 glycosyl hydrolase [Croceitalea sp. F388]